jgi:putative lipoic acid-binding regulatory protein
LDGEEMKVSLEVINFEEEMRRVEAEVFKLGNAEITKRILYATAQLKIVTPVDTGEAREGWLQVVERSSKGKFLSGSIINRVEHISVLNNGHSQQAPKYFIEQVLSTIGLITPI